MDYLVDNRELVMNSVERRYWAEHRPPIQARFIDRLSANEAGLIPAEPSSTGLSPTSSFTAAGGT